MGPRVLIAWLASLVVAFALGWVGRGLPISAPSEAAMQEALDAALGEPDSDRRLERLGALLRRLDSENLPGAVAALEAHRDHGVQESELRMIASAWARLDPRGAFERARDEWPQRRARRLVLSEIVYQWAFRAPGDAAAAVDSLLEGDPAVTEELLMQLVRAWSQTQDFQAAADYVAALPRSGLRQQLVAVLAFERWRSGGAEALIAWAESVPENAPRKFRLVVFRKAASRLAMADPERAAAWIARHHGEDWGNGTTRIVANRWVESDPEAALSWLLQRPDDDERLHAISTAFNAWLRQDAAGAEAWLRQAPPESGLDPAVAAFARKLSPESPVEALGWARRIQQIELREATLTAIGRQWFARDPDTARAWLAGSDLPREVSEAIRRPASRRPLRSPPPGPAGAPEPVGENRDPPDEAS